MSVFKKCKKCDKDFRCCVKIDGKWRNLNGRNYCLDCLPFGSKNFKNFRSTENIPAGHLKCTKCGGTFPEDEFYARDDNISKNRSWCRKCIVEGIRERTRARKKLAVEYLGGKCQKCGYNKCIDALDFHHRDPNSKEFGINKILRCSIETLKKELDKCDLLCANCHRELHYELNHEDEEDETAI